MYGYEQSVINNIVQSDKTNWNIKGYWSQNKENIFYVYVSDTIFRSGNHCGIHTPVAFCGKQDIKYLLQAWEYGSHGFRHTLVPDRYLLLFEFSRTNYRRYLSNPQGS
jgi:hypothetical protein